MAMRERKVEDFVTPDAEPGPCVYRVWDPSNSRFDQCTEDADTELEGFPFCTIHAETVTEILTLVQKMESRRTKQRKERHEEKQIETIGG